VKLNKLQRVHKSTVYVITSLTNIYTGCQSKVPTLSVSVSDGQVLDKIWERVPDCGAGN